MADPLGFTKYKRAKHPYRPVEERKEIGIRSWPDSTLVPSENRLRDVWIVGSRSAA